ncbi:uncharacterized protein [Typha angustifolia]|uniref:uncharacterized protein n=1 Tax=Typha angustifolia TaxID=59011 RepID=UPI003C2C2580
MATESISSSTNSVAVDESAPLWKYVTKLEKMGEGGGNMRFQCNYCQQIYKGSYYRVKAHVMRISGCGIKPCPKVNSQHIVEMKRIMEQAELKIKNSMPKSVPLPMSTQYGTSSKPLATSSSNMPYGSKKRRSGETALEKSFNMASRNQLHSQIARMFYSVGLPFHLARNPYYVKSYTFATNSQIAGYLPPGYNMLRTTLLQQERANIERLLEPIKGTWKEKGVSIMCDGWTDAQRRPLINFLAVTENGPMFLRAVNCEGEYKDKFFISSLISKVIEEVGAQNVVQVITDNAPVCKSAGMLIEAQYSNIFWTPCVVHTLNLALKNICASKNTEGNELVFDECSWISIVAGDVMCIKNFIMQHSMRLAIFNEFVNLKLIAVADTRFASTIVMLRRFKTIKCGLQTMVINDKWNSYREDDVAKAQFVKEKVLDDIWWDKIEYILSFTEPIYSMLRLADTDKPCLHLIYEMWDDMIERVKTAIYRHEAKKEDEESAFYSVVHKILVDRWDRSNTPLHCLAHSLNPRYYTNTWISEDPNRTPPHKDLEISRMRNKCLKRFFANGEERRILNNEYANFSTATEGFDNYDSIEDRDILDPKKWWVIHGAFAPNLQNLALKLLGQPCSSSCCERNWSTYSFIHTMKRNKITPQRAEDLVFIHNNLRLLSRRSTEYMEGETKMWDVGGDSFDSFDGAGILEVADLSLDEPDLEAIVFTDEGNEETGLNGNE